MRGVPAQGVHKTEKNALTLKTIDIEFQHDSSKIIKLDISFRYEQKHVYDNRYCHKMEDSIPGKLW